MTSFVFRVCFSWDCSWFMKMLFIKCKLISPSLPFFPDEKKCLCVFSKVAECLQLVFWCPRNLKVQPFIFSVRKKLYGGNVQLWIAPKPEVILGKKTNMTFEIHSNMHTLQSCFPKIDICWVLNDKRIRSVENWRQKVLWQCMCLPNISETSIFNVMNYANGHCIITPATDLRDLHAFNLPKPIIDNPNGFLKRTHSKGYYIISVLLERANLNKPNFPVSSRWINSSPSLHFGPLNILFFNTSNYESKMCGKNYFILTLQMS